MIALMLGAAYAWTTKTGDICVQGATAFDDLAGHWWVQNIDRPFRGLKVTIVDRNGARTRVEYLDDGNTSAAGCLVGYSIDVSAGNPTFELKAHSRIRVNGVYVDAWEGLSPATKDFKTIVWTPTLTSSATFTVTRTISSTGQWWKNLLVAGMVFRNYTWRVDQGNDRGCCLPTASNYDEDSGTCPSPSTGGYFVHTTAIQMQTDPDADNPAVDSVDSCCASSLIDDSDRA